ncbi:serine/arginine-rich splicing factor RS40-like isoform X1 [Trifolium pratense]|uniref:Uncharacterized protein n=2 Tax=Trifolium pratense TaxID=57577 RepID=A0ACB0KKD2_TRIPR|nr:serine/arginine-rich splicing factor RS40-like isoform X1 [Trifolium pratense]CAJ2657694.1 unnamed protein product [Trifolium pratense]
MSMLFLDGCASLHFFYRMCPSFSFLYFSRRNNLICPSLAILHSLSIHTFSFLMTFAQCSISDMFQHMNHDDFANVAGFAFIYMEDERDAEYAIRRLDQTEFGRKGRRIRVEWTKQERDNRRSGGDSKKSSTNTRPSKTLFIINFDPVHTRTRDLERHFDPYGKISNLRIRRNFAFIQFETQEEATKALEATNLSKFMDRVITVEYAIRDDDVKKDGYSPDRRGRGSPEGRYGRGRSPSPYRRGRGSPDYGRGSNPASRPEPRGSPKYERAESPVNGRYDRYDPSNFVFLGSAVYITLYFYNTFTVHVADLHHLVDQVQLPDLNQEEAPSMNELRAQMGDMIADLPHLVIGRGHGHDPEAAE